MNVFNSVKGLHPKRNAFSAHTYRNDFTGYMGLNIPVYQQHVVPGSRVRVEASALVRLQALISPVMDNIDYYVHFWQIPYRLLESDRFTAFISSEIEPEEYDALFASPYALAEGLVGSYSKLHKNLTGFNNAYSAITGNGSLLDMLGYDKGLFPTPVGTDTGDFGADGNDEPYNWRPVIAYFMLHEHWYMNENVPYFDDFVELVDKLVKDQDLSALCDLLVSTYLMEGFTMLPHGWDKDYFTSALPNVQFGEPVTLPIAGSAPVIVDAMSDMAVNFAGDGSGGALRIDFKNGTAMDIGDTETVNTEIIQKSLDGVDAVGFLNIAADGHSSRVYNLRGNISSDEELTGTADLSEATAITINELRFANALQIFKERQLRFGRRRIEHYKGFFDVTPEDLRLQVPRYLGGGRIPINIADIEQTSGTSGSQVLGHLAGKGTAVAGAFAGFTTFCSEESIIIGFAFSMPHQTYAQAVSKMLLKTNDIYDYFNPCFEHLGEQVIQNQEIYAASQDPTGEFGYTPRYNEYRFHLNEMHGAFKDTLSYWTLGRIFSDTPALNADFIYMQPTAFNRIFAVANQPNMLVSMLFRTRIIQPVSKYGTPMLLN